MALTSYHSKRRFEHTPEPKGKVARGKNTRLRFVVQKHAASHLHYDFRLELDGVLKSWAVPKGPSLNPKDKRLAMMVEDHPFEYRTFEGVIPVGNYGAGTVMVWDDGWYAPIGTGTRREQEEKIRNGLVKGHLAIVLHGKKLTGAYDLILMRGKGKDGRTWLLVKKDDDSASSEDITQEGSSAASGKTMDEIARQDTVSERLHAYDMGDAPAAPMPTKINPMLATLVDQPFDRDGWLFEMKIDGYRAIAQKKHESAVLYSRKQNEFTDMYPELAHDVRRLTHDVVLDGEIAVLDEQGVPQFQLLQQFLEDKKGTLVYYAFDVLWVDGRDVRMLPLIKRKALLRHIIPGNSRIRYVDYIVRDGRAFFAAAENIGLEGVIAKDGRSVYATGMRSHSWLKIKTEQHQEAIICGFTKPRGTRKQFGALVLGIYKRQVLTYIGHTGGGFTDSLLEEVYKILVPLAQKKSPFAVAPKTNMPVTWVKPVRVCEVKFSGWTEGGHMRHPVFIGLRDDKDPKDIGKETAEHTEQAVGHIEASEKVRFTNPGKIFWPKEGITKGDVIAYYRSVAEVMLPYLMGRPQSLNRHPNGIDGKSFYQKDAIDVVPSWFDTAAIHSDTEEKDIHYAVCNDVESLLFLINLGCIEINIWNSRVSAIDRPDYLVIDLDPDDISFTQVIAVAQTIHTVCDTIGIPTYCKTSGKTGLHIFIPLGAAYTYEQTRRFSELLVRVIHAKTPQITSIDRDPKKRRGKIYLDYLQNRRGQTMAAPYSIRPVPSALVSAPLAWREVRRGLRSEQFTYTSVRSRLDRDEELWAPVLGKGIDMLSAIELLEQRIR